MKKVLIFSTAYIPFIGGAEIAVKNITDRLKGDFEFHMITLNLDGKQEDSESVGNVTVHRIGGPGKISKLLFPFTAFLKALSLHKQHTFDATWSIMASFGGFAALFLKKKNPHIPFVLTLQEGDPIPDIEKKVRWVWPLFTRIFTSADRVQAISRFLADWASRMGAKNISVIPNGVNIKQFENRNEHTLLALRQKLPGIGKEDVCLITTSRLTEKNAVECIIEALLQLDAKYKLLILGVGHLEQKLQNLVADKNLSDRVIFLGLQSEQFVIAGLHHSDIFIRPSRSEGMGNSFIEAMAAGIPVIATPVGGIVDFLEDGKTGLFCELDNPNSIAEAVVRLDTDTDLRESIITNAKHMVKERYDWDHIAERMKKEVFVNI